MELKEAYMIMQENCGIEVGDTVKVLRKAKDNEMGWKDLWNFKMDSIVGEEAKVESLDGNGIYLHFNDTHKRWWFPFFVLEIVKKKSKKKTVTLELTEEQLEKVKEMMEE